MSFLRLTVTSAIFSAYKSHERQQVFALCDSRI
jgi:hypothetical protein